jgi:FtsZ-binding cell division protein ZapB
MENDRQSFGGGLERLNKAVQASVNRLMVLRAENKELKEEANELRRLLAISERKAQRLKGEIHQVTLADEKSWQVRERTIKQRLKRLATKLSAFEQSCIMES